MNTTEQIHQVFDDAMALPVEARMVLVESLIQSSPMDTPDVPGEKIDENESRRLWLEVCKQRWEAIESEQSESVDAQTVLAEAKARLERRRK